MAVSKRLRFEILRRDGHKCHHCGRQAPQVALTVDHVIPVALGGSDDPSNLRAACADCNSGKSSIPADAPMVAQVSEDAARWAAAMKEVARQRAEEHRDRKELMDWFYGEWNSWTNYHNETWDADGAEKTIPTFLEAGLSRDDIVDLIRVSMRSRSSEKWRYFCGCCWKLIREVQDRAADLIASEEPGPFTTTLHTFWTVEDIDEKWIKAQEIAASIDNPPAVTCGHVEEGHCGDPLCKLQSAVSLIHMASDIAIYEWKQRLNAARIDDEAEVALGG